VPESDIITSFYLVPEDGKPLTPYSPGQFFPLRLDIPGEPKPLNRTYTLSDCPNPDYYRLSIKR
jgi:nitric oxide dioxygenase